MSLLQKNPKNSSPVAHRDLTSDNQLSIIKKNLKGLFQGIKPKERTLIQPFSEIRRAHGREIGVIECWYTSADKLPKKRTRRQIKTVHNQDHYEQFKQ